METKFTKGEWFVQKGTEQVEVLCRRFPAGIDTIATIHNQFKDETTKANARLIEKAPKLIEALVEIAKGEGRYDMDRLRHAANTIEDMQQLAMAALKEATE